MQRCSELWAYAANLALMSPDIGVQLCLYLTAVAVQERNGAGAAEVAAVAKPKAQVPVDADMEAERRLAAMVCSLENKDACLACGS